MNLPAVFLVLRWMVRDTFRQSLGSRTFWLILGLNALAILLCLSVQVDGFTAQIMPGDNELTDQEGRPFETDTARIARELRWRETQKGIAPAAPLSPPSTRGHLTVGFGLIRLEQSRDGATEVLFLQSMLAKFGAGALGILLVLLWSSGFLPEFVRQDSASVLLAKPVPRWALLVGKYLGVVTFMALQSIVFVGGTWLALGVKTGYWFPNYLLTIPIVVLYFAILFSVMTLLGVWSRSAVISVVGTLLFWAFTAGLTQTRHEQVTRADLNPDRPAPSELARDAVEVSYWVLPKTVDLVYLLHVLLSPPGKALSTVPVLQSLEKQNAFHPEVSLICSLLFGVVVLALAARRFARTDY